MLGLLRRSTGRTQGCVSGIYPRNTHQFSDFTLGHPPHTKLRSFMYWKELYFWGFVFLLSCFLYVGFVLVIGVVCVFLFGVVCVLVLGVGGGMRRLFFLKSCTRNLRYYKSPELGLNLSGS